MSVRPKATPVWKYNWPLINQHGLSPGVDQERRPPEKQCPKPLLSHGQQRISLHVPHLSLSKELRPMVPTVRPCGCWKHETTPDAECCPHWCSTSILP